MARPVTAVRRAVAARITPATDGSVTRPELFLDLIFVFAFLSVTTVVAADPRPLGLLEGALLVLLLWRCWSTLTWLGHVVRLDRGLLPPVAFVLAVLLLLLGVGAPEAFTDRAGGLFGPGVFAVAFVLARGLPLLVLTGALPPGPTHRESRASRRAWLPFAVSAPLLLCAAFLPSHLLPEATATTARVALVAVAAAVDLLGVRALGAGRWQLGSVRHWAERHSLIILIGLGEAILSVGISRGLVGDPPITWAVIGGSVLGLVVIAGLWWMYFDLAQPSAEQSLHRLAGPARTALGRDGYTLLHLPIAAGLILLALGLKRALSSTAPADAGQWHRVDVLILYGGVALYLLGLLGFERRSIRLWGRGPITGVALLAATLPLASRASVLGALALLTAVTVTVVAADLTVFRRRHRALHAAVREAAPTVTPNELFFDLVFVYAFIQVTVLFTRNLTGFGIVQGLGLLALLWSAWCCYALLAVLRPTGRTSARLNVLAVGAFMLVLGIAIPQAFSYVPGGLPGPVIFVSCYLAVRLLHLAASWRATRQRPDQRRHVVHAAIPTGVAALMLLAAVSTGPGIDDPRRLGTGAAGLWLVAVLVDLGGNYLVSSRTWAIAPLEHWTERFALIILIAVGEAVNAMGVALTGRRMALPALLGIVTGALLLCTLWWAYFAPGATSGAPPRAAARGPDRATLARDAYAYLHLPIVVGLLLVALGLHTLLAVDEPATHHGVLGRLALFGGTGLYLLANLLFRWRLGRRVRRLRVGGLVTVLVLTPVSLLLPPLPAAGLLTISGLGFVVLDRFTPPATGRVR
ncbi:low temperature requirement protein A [Micromonospora sp. MS34]|uniref:low temperature requirement protein A n=1 Tax=Micromonospora sp. MS34 TaxID=3385971 RepID=UPI0039A38686